MRRALVLGPDRVITHGTSSPLTEVGHQLVRLLGQANISLAFPLQARVKEWQSIADKLPRISVPVKRLREPSRQRYRGRSTLNISRAVV